MMTYAVMGYPMAHSQSPSLYRTFASSLGLPTNYSLLTVPPIDFEQALASFWQQGGQGLNLSLPFKHTVCSLVDRLTERAHVAQAANVLWCDDKGGISGDNVDGSGWLADIQRLGWSLKGARLLILGAGGAVAGLLPIMMQCCPADIVLVNRDVAKATALAARHPGVPIRVLSYDALAALERPRFDGIINGTAASLYKVVPDLSQNIVCSEGYAYDLVYRPGGRTVFLDWANRQGVQRLADGFGMLVYQAALSFELWHSIKPEPALVTEVIARGYASCSA